MVGYIVGTTLTWDLAIRDIIISAAGVGVVLLLLRALALRSFTALMKKKIMVTTDRIKSDPDNFAFNDITRVVMRLTSRGLVRDVSVRHRNGQAIIFNALENFSDFLSRLTSHVSKLIVTTSREPLGYDQPLFYIIIGSVTGSAVTLAIGYIAQLKGNIIFLIAVICAIILFALVVYFIVNRPLSKRYPGRARLAEIICGAFSIVSSIAIGTWLVR